MQEDKKIERPIDRVFAQYASEMGEQFEQFFEVGGLTSLPRPYIIRRMPDGHTRKYFTKSGDKPILASGISAIVQLIKKQHGGFDFLPKYRESIGAEAADQELTETSALGTFMHILCAEICDIWQRKDENYFIDFGEEFKKCAIALLAENGVPRNKHAEYFKRIVKGAQSMYHFLQEYKVEVVAIEYCVVDFDNNICTPLDIVAYIQEPKHPTAAASKKGETTTYGERELVNLQIKFREKACDYPTDHIQSLLEMYMFNKYTNKQFGEMKRSFILMPKSQAIAKIGCNVVEAKGYDIEELLGDIDYAKTKKNNADIFFPDFGRNITNMGSVRIGGDGIHYPFSQNIGDFILSHFKD